MNRRSNQGLRFPPLVLGVVKPRPEQAAEADTPLAEAAAPELDTPVESAVDPVEAILEPPPVLELEPSAMIAADAPPAEAAEALPQLELEPAKPPRRTKPEKVKKPAKAAAPPEPVATPTAKTAGPMAMRLPIWARWAYPVGLVLAVLWAGTLIAFSTSYANRWGAFEYRPFPLTIFGALVVLPAVFILLGAYLLRQAANLSLETRRARALADELAIPAALAVDQAGGAADAVRREVARAAEAGEAAEKQLLSLRQALAEESDRLVAATEEAERTARALTESLSRERTELAALTAGLDHQVETVNETIGRQTRLVVETSDLAAAQLQEAEAALAARATDLAAAAGEAGEAAELAGEALARQAERLENAGEIVGNRLQALNDSLGRGHSRLADLAVQLQADQQALAERLEAQRLSALAAAAEVQTGVVTAADSAHGVADALRDLIAEADERLRTVAATVQGEQAALDARARASLSLFRDAVAEERAAIEAETQAALTGLAASAEDTRAKAAADLHTAEQAAAQQAEIARARVEELGEAAFAAGQKADQAFDARIAAARRTIEQAAALVDEAGQASVARIDAGLANAKLALGELEVLLATVDAKIASAPEQARAQAEAVRTAVEKSLGEIAEAARKTASETESLDAALQERVRRNYEMLSDALKTMNKVATVTEQAAARQAATPPAPAPAPAVSHIAAIARPAPTPAPQPSAPAASFAERAIRVPPQPAPEPLRPAALASSEMGLRPRLRLTPEDAPQPAAPAPVQAARAERAPPVTHDTIDAFIKPAAPTPARHTPPKDTSAWTWKDLLSSIDEPPIDDEVLAERLIAEIESLGLDAAALLPLPQIDAIAAAMQKGDVEAVREAVRGLAPSAVRRLSRRVLTDKVLRAQADRYVRRYEDLLNDSARRDQEGFMTAALLGSDPGRAFLLFDAAVGELH